VCVVRKQVLVYIRWCKELYMFSNYKQKFFNLISVWIPHSWKSWLTIVSVFFIIIGHTGLWVMPNIGAQFAVSQSLSVNPFSDPSAHYIFTNYFQPLIFGVFWGSTLYGYIVYAFIITICFLLLFLLWFIKFHGEKVAIEEYKTLIPILFPVFMVPLYWIGMDGMTLLLMLIIMINFSSKWVIIPAMLLALQHFEQGFMSFLILFGTVIISIIFSYDRIKFEAFKKIFYVICGVIFGKMLLMLIFFILHINMSGDRITYMKSNASLYVEQWKLFWPYILFSLIGICWVLIFLKIKKTWPLLTGIIFTFFLLLIIGDQTRVGTIVLFPAVFFWIFMDKELWVTLNKKLVFILIAIYLVLPVFFVWGFPFRNLWVYDILEIRSIQKSGISIMQSDPIKPFRRN
jgi:hypothetical protein